MNIEEWLLQRLKKKAKFYYGMSSEKQPDISLADALKITKDLFTKEQVEELLKKQKEICAGQLIYFCKDTGENWNNEQNIILNAPSPSLEGGKK